MGRKQRLGIFLLSSLVICTGCTTKQEQDRDQNLMNPIVTIQPVATLEPVLTKEQEQHEELLSRAFVTSANTNSYRMKKVMEKAKNGEEVTIAYIGGSITEGYNAGTTDHYVKLTAQYFQEHFANQAKVQSINAGISGTPSILGLIRSNRDIFSYQPDIIFIEFAVNDGSSMVDISAFESLVRKSLMQENEPAVVLLFSCTSSWYTCQDTMANIGYQYGLPMISVKDAIYEEIESNRMTWADWSNDEAHPNATGHKLYAEFITHYWDRIAQQPMEEPFEIPSKTKNGKDWTSMVMYENTNLELLQLGSFELGSNYTKFTNGWTRNEEVENNDALTFSFTGTSLFATYVNSANQSYGYADVYVDGEYIMTLGKSSGAWGGPATDYVYRGEKSETHTVEIKMAPGSENKKFELLCFGVAP